VKTQTDVRFIAFYLPQFHPIPENDEWWGKGFTEWTTTTRARPLFEGHYQPHLPADLGFYDLRLAETRYQQIALARSYGIDGFCYHYYWFSGRRLLERPLEAMLADASSDIPFCLSWANENWSRRWNAAEHEVLLGQEYRPGDDLHFIEDAARFLRDPRYIRVDGAPLLIVYRPQQIPECSRWLDTWRSYCRSNGIGDLHLAAALTHGNQNFKEMGFDSGVEFPPHNLGTPSVNASVQFFAPFTGNVFRFADVAQSYLSRDYTNERVFRTVVPSWDNAARTGPRCTALLDGTPANYESWLRGAVDATVRERQSSERLVFINAWNEWAEGCHLEPDQRFGHGFLEATRRVKEGLSHAQGFATAPLEIARKRSLVGDLRDVLIYHTARQLGPLRLWVNKHPRLKALANRIVGRGNRV
jgi:lipopolysaccharide biosynthesis protein